MNRASGNVLFMILIAIALLSALTFVATRGQQGGGNISNERTRLAADQIISFALDIKRAVESLSHNSISETDLKFAHVDLTGYGTADANPTQEIFNIRGGGAGYIDVPNNINDGSQWEFYGFSAAPNVGDDATPDLMLVLPNVTESFCRALNKKAGYTEGHTIPQDTSTCLHNTASRFSGSFATGGAINTMDTTNFRLPAPFACVECSGPAYHAYYVLSGR